MWAKTVFLYLFSVATPKTGIKYSKLLRNPQCILSTNLNDKKNNRTYMNNILYF